MAKARIGIYVTALFGIFFQLILKDILFTTLGIWRHMQPIEDFKYECRKIQNPLLESCEDMWLDEEGRTLYAACSDLVSRKSWNPNGGLFNLSARSLTDHVAVLNIDKLDEIEAKGPSTLKIIGEYKNAGNGKEINLIGFDAEVLSPSLLRFWMVNNRPSVDPTTGELLDAKQHGANSTIEVFELRRGTLDWQYIRTISSKAVVTPNRIAATGDGAFVCTNDHDSKIGVSRELEAILGGGSLTYCDPQGQCHLGQDRGFNFPNGLVRGKDGLYYVPNSINGKISVHALGLDKTFKKVDEISLGMPVDNLSVDADGSIIAAGLPKLLTLFKALEDPYHSLVPSTVWQIRQVKSQEKGKEYAVDKIIEDKHGKMLPAGSTAVHDTKTGRLFLSGPASHFVSVCEKRK